MNENRTYSELSDKELAAACAAIPVDIAAWEVLYRRYRAIVEAKIARKSGLPRAQVEELMQETFLRLFRSLPQSVAHEHSLSAIVRNVASRVVIDNWRHTKPETAATEALTEDPISVRQESRHFELPDSFVESVLHAEAERFSKLQDRDIAKCLIDEISGPTIAKTMGVTEYRVYRIRAELMDRVLRALRAERDQQGLSNPPG